MHSCHGRLAKTCKKRWSWIWLLALLLWGCGDFGGDYGYQGAQRVVLGPYHVRSVFWLASEPIVLASWHEADKPPQMHMVKLVSGDTCKAGPLSSYVAAVDDRGFRLALTDSKGNLRFYDEYCRNKPPVVPNSEHLRVFIYDGHYQYVLQQGGGSLLTVDPFEGTQHVIAKDVEEFAPSTLSVGPDYPFALWVLHTSGEFALYTVEGKKIGKSFEQISDFSYVSSGATPLLMLQDDKGIHLYQMDQEGISPPTATLLLDEDEACAAQILGIPACVGASCPNASATSSNLRLPMPWLAMEAPCGSGDLLLRSMDGSRRLEVAGAAAQYAVFPGTPGQYPTLFFNAARGDMPVQTYYGIVDNDVTMLDTKSTGERFDLASLGLSPARTHYTVITSETHPRYGLWNAKDGFSTLLKDVEDLYGNLLLHGFDGVTGTLAVCDEDQCQDLAKRVPPGGFVRYTTVPRVGEGISVIAYLRDYDADAHSGTLRVQASSLGLSTTVDHHVTGFLDVESGPVRGIVYSVDEGKGGRQGIWFAPR